MSLEPESQTLHDIDLMLRNVRGARTESLALELLIQREAEVLVAAHGIGHPATAYLIRGDKYCPEKSHAKDAEILSADLSLDQARTSMVRWHWFRDGADVEPHAQEIVDPRFEAACDAIVSGDAGALRALVAADPALVHARSRFAHHQTLLQHVAANGIEHSRQWQSPANAVEIAQILLAAGAAPDLDCDSYGGSTAMGLLVTSAHPAAAGVQAALVETLVQAGAKVDGLEDDGGPLWSAISSWYPRAAEALVRRGARVDNLLFAAAVGDLAAVKSYFDEAGNIVPARAHNWGRAATLEKARRPQQRLEPKHALPYALHWAAAFRRREVVEFLLSKAPDFNVNEPTWNNTALQAATYSGDPAIIALLAPWFDATGRPRWQRS